MVRTYPEIIQPIDHVRDDSNHFCIIRILLTVNVYGTVNFTMTKGIIFTKSSSSWHQMLTKLVITIYAGLETCENEQQC